MVLAGKKLGVAYYEVETAHLYIMPDMAEAEGLGLMHRGEKTPTHAASLHVKISSQSSLSFIRKLKMPMYTYIL